MDYVKERSFRHSAHVKTPYSRPNTHAFFKTPNRPSPSSNNSGKTFVPAKPHGFINRHLYPNQYQQLQNHPALALADDMTDSVSVNEYFGPSTSRYADTVKNQFGEFQPRKSHLDNKTLVPFQELETMSLSNMLDVTDVSRKSKFTKTTQETSASDSLQIKVRENLLRIFSGSVANLFQWSKLTENFCILFEVRAELEYVEPGRKWPSEVVLHLTDSKAGPRMQALYYEIDRPLPRLPPRSVVRCVGRLSARNRLYAFKVEEISEEERIDGQRLSFICNRAAEELKLLQQQQKK